VEVALSALNIPRALVDEQKENLRCGVPYTIPTGVAHPLAQMWLEAIDAFSPRRWKT